MCRPCMLVAASGHGLQCFDMGPGRRFFLVAAVEAVLESVDDVESNIT